MRIIKKLVFFIAAVMAVSVGGFAVGCAPADEGNVNNPPIENPGGENPDENPDDEQPDGEENPDENPPEEEDPSAEYPKDAGEVENTETYVENAVYMWNDITDRRVYGIEIEPKNIDGKVPMVVYVHGFQGNAYSLIDEPEALAAQGIAGFTIECCGGTRINPQSGGGPRLFPADYTSRITDLETAIEYVKTLDYVDTDQIYIYGQSYGGLVTMMDAPRHNDDINGIILESTGLTEDGGMLTNGQETQGAVPEYASPEDWESYINQWNGDVIILCSQGDGAHAGGEYTSTVYERRSQGRTKFYSFADGDHTWLAFTEEAKQYSLDAMASLILKGEIMSWNSQTQKPEEVKAPAPDSDDNDEPAETPAAAA